MSFVESADDELKETKVKINPSAGALFQAGAVEDQRGRKAPNIFYVIIRRTDADPASRFLVIGISCAALSLVVLRLILVFRLY